MNSPFFEKSFVNLNFLKNENLNKSLPSIKTDSSSKKMRQKFEERLNCIICWKPSLRMVYGICQHRFCEDCLYGNDDMLKPTFSRCPVCSKENVFSATRPSVPEDNMLSQKCLGITQCSFTGCPTECWCWELEAHQSVCPFKSKKKSPRKSRKNTPSKRRSEASLDYVKSRSSTNKNSLTKRLHLESEQTTDECEDGVPQSYHHAQSMRVQLTPLNTSYSLRTRSLNKTVDSVNNSPFSPRVTRRSSLRRPQ